MSERYAIMFHCKPGTEETVAQLFKEYDRPVPEIDETTRLVSTSVFMHGTLIVRVLEVEGDLIKAIKHLQNSPAVREVEDKLTPYMLEERDLSTPEGAQAFFMKAMMSRVTHRVAGEEKR